MPAPPGFTATDEGRVLVAVADRAWLGASGLASVEAAFAHVGQARGRYKSIATVDDPSGAPVFLKRYDYHRGEVFLRGALKLNLPVYSGPVELENLLQLTAAGFRVPRPLAAGEVDVGGRRRSFVALACLHGQPLEALPPPTTAAGRRARVHAVADLARRLHAAGFWHRDFYLCNLFWAEGQPLGFLDCERVGQRAGGPRLRWRVKDLAALDYSAAWPTQTERLRALLAYLGLERLTPDAKRLARAVRRKARAIARHGAKGP